MKLHLTAEENVTRAYGCANRSVGTDTDRLDYLASILRRPEGRIALYHDIKKYNIRPGKPPFSTIFVRKDFRDCIDEAMRSEPPNENP